MSTTTLHDVAVIGAGMSGLSAAKRLREAGLNVVVVEKSRGVGGRAATRRMTLAGGEEIPVDHGAQFFTARDLRFQDQVARWQERGICFPWSEGFMTWQDGSLHEPEAWRKDTRYACCGGMSQLGKFLAEGLNVVREFQVDNVMLEEGIWQLYADSAHSSSPVSARALLVSAPLPQAMKLVGNRLSLEQLEFTSRITCGSCVAVIARYSDATESPLWHGIQVRDLTSPISWMAWDSSRRNRGTLGAFAVIHASSEYSSLWLEASKEELKSAGEELLKQAALIGRDWMKHPVDLVVHRWRYAHPKGPSAPSGFLKAPCPEPLYFMGDGLNGGRIEGAWLSGLFAAEDLLLKAFSL